MSAQLSLQEDNSIVISSIANKGGSGKTSLLTNLAGVMNHEEKKSLIVDFDPQRNISDTFRLKPSTLTTQQMFINDSSVQTKQLIGKYNGFIDIIQSSRQMNVLEQKLIPLLKNNEDPYGFVEPHIQRIRHKYDFVFLDCPPSLGMVTQNVMAATDYIIIPFIPEPYSIAGLETVIETVKNYKKSGYKIEILAVVPMRIHAAVTIHNEIMQDARLFCELNDIYMTDEYIPNSILYVNSIGRAGLPATMNKSMIRDKAVQPYFKLWDELKKRLPAS